MFQQRSIIHFMKTMEFAKRHFRLVGLRCRAASHDRQVVRHQSEMPFGNRSTLWTLCAVVVGSVSLAQSSAAVSQSKTMRVDHGRPVVVVSDKAVVLLEFAKEPIADALVPNSDPDIRHCRARYRYQFYDGATDSVTNGQGTVEEIYKTVLRTPTGNQVKDVGCRVGISAGAFSLTWSEGGAGARSWIYYRTDSPVRFIQQPQRVDFDSVDREQFRRYLASRNVEEFVSSGRSVQVIGPAVFSGDLPTEAPVSGRVESGRVHEGAFELKLSDLATNQHYIIESSYDIKSGSWAPRHAFTARQANLTWSDPLGKDANVMFYRIRAGTY